MTPVWPRILFWSVVAAGVVAASVVLSGSKENPVTAVVASWQTVAVAAALYGSGMIAYAWAWAALFERQRLGLALGFIVSQPVKYLPGGIAQPIGQIALGIGVVGNAQTVLLAFPVHVLINVVVAITLGAPLLLVIPAPGWVRWMFVLTPLVLVLLNRTWMSILLAWVGRIVRRPVPVDGLPSQSNILRSFLWALAGHGAMFASFGVLTSIAIPGWTAGELVFAYAIAWLAGYVVLPSPAGIGAREAALVFIIGGSLTLTEMVGITMVHRVMCIFIEIVWLFVATSLARRTFGLGFGRSGIQGLSPHHPQGDHEPLIDPHDA